MKSCCGCATTRRATGTRWTRCAAWWPSCASRSFNLVIPRGASYPPHPSHSHSIASHPPATRTGAQRRETPSHRNTPAPGAAPSVHRDFLKIHILSAVRKGDTGPSRQISCVWRQADGQGGKKRVGREGGRASLCHVPFFPPTRTAIPPHGQSTTGGLSPRIPRLLRDARRTAFRPQRVLVTHSRLPHPHLKTSLSSPPARPNGFRLERDPVCTPDERLPRRRPPTLAPT